ncbi:MAG: V-type ATP synthase subunit E [Limnochordia bacterium]|jgi:V/A-type H+-transporting ATPase subunit E
MSSLTRLKQTLQEEAAAEIKAIRASADERVAAIQDAARKRADEIKAEILADVAREIEELNRRAEAEATLVQRRIMMKAKTELVDEVMRQAAAMLVELPEERYREYLVRLLLAAVPHEGEAQVVLNERDRSRFGDDLLKMVQEALADKEISVQLSMAPQAGTMTGGFKLVGADFEVDASIERILAGTGELLEPEIAAILFGNER